MSAEEPKALDGDGENACPKRPWVMVTLSDDDAVEAGGALPQGLQFHLSRCAACRALADRLRSVTNTIGTMSDLEPGEDLQAQADAQAQQALAEGASVTGRVTIPDEPERLRAASRAPELAWWLRWGSYAAAAAIVFGFGLYGLTMLAGRDGQQTVADGNARQDGRRGPQQKPVEQDPYAVSERISATGREGPEVPGEIASSDQEPRLADNQMRSRGQVCRHRSHVEAASCDNPNCIYRATVLPDARQRDLGWGNALFDMPRHTMSTTRRDRGE